MMRFEHIVADFQEIAATSMRDIALNHPKLRVELVQVRSCEIGTAGILITPWMMNLTVFPDVPVVEERVVRFPATEVLMTPTMTKSGGYLFCHLFSPMTQFADHATVLAVADEVMKALYCPSEVDVSRRRLFHLAP